MRPPYWNEACQVLKERDSLLGKIITAFESEALSTQKDPFYTLARCIVGQQISARAAESIWRRFAALTKVIPAEVVLHEHFREIGITYKKSEYLLGLARYFLGAQPSLDPDDLIRIKGIGPWSITMFRIFYLQEADIFPIKDVGMKNAISDLYFDRRKVEDQTLLEFSERWRPFRTVATWYFWRNTDTNAVIY